MDDQAGKGIKAVSGNPGLGETQHPRLLSWDETSTPHGSLNLESKNSSRHGNAIRKGLNLVLPVLLLPKAAWVY